MVLDEADVMLDMGFIDDIQFILDLTPDERNTSLWSATMPPEIMRLAETNMNMPKRILVILMISVVMEFNNHFW